MDLSPSTTIVAIGTLNEAIPHFRHAHGDGIALYSFDERDGKLSFLTSETSVANPTYIALDPRRNRLFATSERFGKVEGEIHGFDVNASSGLLTWQVTQATRGSLTAFCGLDRTGRVLLAANYAHDDAMERPGRHIASFAIDDHGKFGPAASEHTHSGNGPRRDRQTVPHAHCAVCSPDNRFVLVSDLGTDTILIYSLDARDGRLALHDRFVMPAGAGPRQLAFSPDGKRVYVVNELDATLSVLAYAHQSGQLSALQHRPLFATGNDPSMAAASPAKVASIPAPQTAPASTSAPAPADIQVSADGMALYVSVRGANTVATCLIDASSGLIIDVAHRSSGGETPRSLTLSPCQQFLLVANQDSDHMRVYRLDEQSRAPTFETDVVSIGTPMCVRSARFSKGVTPD